MREMIIIAAGLWLAPALASGQGRQLGPDPTLEFEGNLGYSATAATLLSCGALACGGGGGQDCEGLSQAAAVLDDIPESETLRVVHARLNWVASTAAGAPPDDAVTLTPPGGDPIAVAANPMFSEQFRDGAPPQDCMVVGLLCGLEQPACDLNFYSNHADVTAQIVDHYSRGGTLNGEWRVSDADIPGATGGDPALAIAAVGSLTIGAWSILIIYEDAAALPLRRIYYYQGFELNSGQQRRLFPSGFLAPGNPRVDMTFMVLEGDAGTVGDQMSVNGRQVQDACNPFNNLFNSTVNTGRADGSCRRDVTGVDLDRFALDDAIMPGDEEANIIIDVPMGGGFTPGEQIFTDWLVLQFDHRLPDFEGLKPEKQAQPPSRSTVEPGQTIDYVIIVENNGDDFATSVRVTDTTPAHTTYVPGSAKVDRQPIPDGPGGNNPLQGGLLLTGLPQVGAQIEPMERHLVSFQVTVDPDVAQGTQITNVASIGADLVDDIETDPVFHAVGVLPDGGFVDPDAGPDASVPLEAGPRPDWARPPDSQAPDRDPLSRDAAPPSDNPCGPGTHPVDGVCQSICGEGLVWDPNCGAEGQCRQEAQPACEGPDGGSGSGGGGGGCGCGFQPARGTAGGGLLLLAALLLLRRRRAL